MRSLNNPGMTVPGEFKWFCAETGKWVPPKGGMPSYTDFIAACKAHCRSNNLPIGSQWEQQIQDQLCTTLDGAWCNEGGIPVRPMGGWGFDIQAVLQGTRTLASWLIKGKGRKVEVVEAERRALICAGCPQNQNPDACTSCAMESLRQVVIAVVGGSATVYDNQLKSCKICGCSLKAKVHLPLSILRDNMTEGQMQALPANCWLK